MDCCFFKQKTAYEMRIRDWSSDVCSSDLAEDLRQQDHAVEIGAVLRLQHIGEHRRARGAVAFAKQVFRRIPALVARQESLDETGERLGIGIDAPKRLLAFLAAQVAEAGAGCIDEHQIGRSEERRVGEEGGSK